MIYVLCTFKVIRIKILSPSSVGFFFGVQVLTRLLHQFLLTCWFMMMRNQLTQKLPNRLIKKTIYNWKGKAIFWCLKGHDETWILLFPQTELLKKAISSSIAPWGTSPIRWICNFLHYDVFLHTEIRCFISWSETEPSNNSKYNSRFHNCCSDGSMLSCPLPINLRISFPLAQWVSMEMKTDHK